MGATFDTHSVTQQEEVVQRYTKVIDSRSILTFAGTDVGVVCAGAKSILHIGLTLEYLETHGVQREKLNKKAL
jgi:pseudouridine-5'-phosphate glycosidase